MDFLINIILIGILQRVQCEDQVVPLPGYSQSDGSLYLKGAWDYVTLHNRKAYVYMHQEENVCTMCALYVTKAK